MYKRNRSRFEKHMDFIIIDFIGLHISFFLAYFFRYSKWDMYDRPENITLSVVASILFAFCAIGLDNYSGILRRRKTKELFEVVKCQIIMFSGSVAYLFIVHNSASYSRIFLSLAYVIDLILMLIGRIVYKNILLFRLSSEKYLHHILLIADDYKAEKYTESFKKRTTGDLRIVACALIGHSDLTGVETPAEVIGRDTNAALEYALSHVVDEVIVDLSNTKKSRKISEILIDMGITVHISADSLIGRHRKISADYMPSGLSITASPNFVSPFQSMVKRIMDIVGGLIGLIFTAIIFAIVAPIIKIQSPGPVFFSQNRVGKNGRIFKIYKFRSMYVGAEEKKKDLMKQNEMNGLMFKINDDPRIFPFGKILRKFSLDEFPQFWNVLKGDMSLVGTRPPTTDEYAQYELRHKSRLAVKPGLTGMWQVSGRSDIKDFEEVVNLDNHYIRNWTIFMDIKIILKTIAVVLNRKGSA